MAKPLQVAVFAPGHLGQLQDILAGVHARAPQWAVTQLTPMPPDPPLARYVARMQQMPFDAFICDADFELWRLFRPDPRPIVWFFGWQQPPSGPSVRIREEQVGRLGAEFLCEQGFVNLAFLGAEPIWSLRRQRGFLEVARRAGRSCALTYPEPAQPGQPEWPEIFQHEFLMEWAASLPKPVAVMVCSAYCASLLTLAVRALELDIPGQVAILAGEEAPLVCPYTTPGLSGVDLGLRRVGYRSADCLAAWLETGQPPANRIELDPVGIVHRRSTEFEPADDELLAAATHYLNTTPLEEARLAEMYRRLPASPRTVQRRFADRLGRSPAQYLQALRIRRARELLRQTPLPLVDIAVRCGFEYVSNLCRSFKDVTGQTPSAFRRSTGAVTDGLQRP
jgi:LacI family transcriptional regulator